MIAEELLKILACPLCKEDVFYDGSKIVCSRCRRGYPIKDNIPVMLVEEGCDEEREKK